MNVLIVEDEKLAAQKLVSLLKDLIGDITIVSIARSVDEIEKQ